MTDKKFFKKETENDCTENWTPKWDTNMTGADH